jgi:hypothetical protein
MPCHAEIAGKSSEFGTPVHLNHFTSGKEKREVKRTGRGQGEIPTLLNIIDDNKNSNNNNSNI